ncbi:MAG: pyridoxal-phosphate-dependent aminotransferase family protein [Candidatus Promineifilaceae bacterium]
MKEMQNHSRLFIPGPTEVRQEILQAQAKPIIGHRSEACAELIARIQPRLRKLFATENRVFINVSSGTGLQEAAIRNCSNEKVLNCVNGAFSDRWRKVSEANGKRNQVLDFPWGQPVAPERVVEALEQDEFDALTIVHNETSTGVTSPIKEIAEAVRSLPQGDRILILVDSVSGVGGIRIDVDDWDLDVVLTSSQKALALPPGLAICSVSDRALEKAKTVKNRGYYFDFLILDKYIEKNQTPYTPAISLLFALDEQLDHILAEGLDNRFERHLAMRDRTLEWSRRYGLSQFAARGYESPTVSCINALPSFSASEMVKFAKSRGMIISDGYGPLKGKSFRIAHMGDTMMEDLEELLIVLDEFMGNLRS